jgi:hypothetical protein
VIGRPRALVLLVSAAAALSVLPTIGAPRARAAAPPATFEVGAAIGNFSPPRFGTWRHDPADCVAGTPLAAVYDGRRQWEFEEPYIDRKGVGHYVLGDPYIDCNHNGRYDGNFLGGGGNNPRYYDYVADPVTARAFVVANGRQNLAIEVLDQEGFFEVYADQIRALVAAAGVHLDRIVISSTHDESAPDTLGLGGPSQAVSGTNDYFLHYLEHVAAATIVRAYRERQPAYIRYAQAVEPANLRQCWSSYPFVDAQLMPVMQAVNAATGAVIVTAASVSQHAETLGFNPDPVQADWVSADWPNFFRVELQEHYGGVAIEFAGAVGSVETPQVFSGDISRTPQQFQDISHPAGCRSEFLSDGSAVPTGYWTETKSLGVDLARAVEQALDDSAQWSASDTIWSATDEVCLPLSNALFLAAGAAGVFAHHPAYVDNCRVQVPPAPNGSLVGNEIRTEVAAYQIGDGGFLNLPGEVFPFTYLGGFLGPEDMPFPQYPMTPLLMAYLHTRWRFFIGLSEDMAGYIFPRGNGVGVPGEYPISNPTANSTDRFGCGHSDDSESVSSQAGPILGRAMMALLTAHYGGPESIVTGRYVLPDGRLSRNPLGLTDSIGCSVDETFQADGPAVAVWVPGRGVVRPAAWLDLDGQAQSVPDRNTRGWIDAAGHHHWLWVFPDIPGAPPRVVVP